MLALVVSALLAGPSSPEIAYPFDREVPVAVYAEDSAVLRALEAVIEEDTRARVVPVPPASVDVCTEGALVEVFRACVHVTAERLGSPLVVIVANRFDDDSYVLKWTYRSSLEDLLTAVEREGRSQALLMALRERLFDLSLPREGPMRLRAATATAAGAAFRAEVLPRLLPALSAAGAAFDGADVVVSVRPDGAELHMDGRRQLLTPEGLRFRGLRPGLHTLDVSLAGRIEERQEFRLAQDELTFELELGADWRTERWVAGVSGLLVLVGGVGLAVYAEEEAGRRPQPFLEGNILPRWSPPENRVVFGDDVEGSGPIIAGMAAGAIVTGGSLAALGILGRREPRPPWLDILISVAAGAAAYGAFEIYAAASD